MFLSGSNFFKGYTNGKYYIDCRTPECGKIYTF